MNVIDNALTQVLAESYEVPNEVVQRMPSPLVSVYTITYNHGPYIRQCIESILKQQTTFAFEYIIGEDCSNDETRELVFDLARKHASRIRVITSERNVGTRGNAFRVRRVCRGKYIAICEGDDYWTDAAKLQKQVTVLEEYPNVVLVAHRAQKVNLHGELLETFPGKYPSIVRPHVAILAGGSFCATNSMMFRRELFADTPAWWRSFPVGDGALLNLAVNRGAIAFINDVMSAYRVGVPGSWTLMQRGDWRAVLRHWWRLDRAYSVLMKHERRFSYWYLAKRLRNCRRYLLAIVSGAIRARQR